ncbi:protoporphyrinogen oxidase HemJ [Roseomonas sp. 18066]|uniref:protoporphyrinogen oxidase HemJ n=1 Tax=Roseomonas sp. 18066 TaxID=2681412 RepID=UPI00135B6413|nr:protoporphyrinogen oxidase HemJ [Roseomonas sp. 18066]
MDALAGWYPWTKALHLVAVIAWMAGLFYLPRLYVYHTPAPIGSDRSELFKVMERRLLRGIMNPAMIATWVLGLTLVATPGVVDWSAGWWHLKFTAVILMSGFHMHLAAARKALLADQRRHSERYWRAMNEVPTVLMVLIVIMVIVKPF